MVAHYLAIQAWTRKLDCIVLSRADLEAFLGLERFKSTRIRWLKEDLKPWFPFQMHYNTKGTESSIHSLYLSRVPIQRHLPHGTMMTEERINQMGSDGPSTAVFKHRGKKAPSLPKILSYVSVLAAGLTVPKGSL
jgi:hypothetical protein